MVCKFFQVRHSKILACDQEFTKAVSRCKILQNYQVYLMNDYGRPLLYAWLHPGLNAKPYNCVSDTVILFSSVVVMLDFLPGVLGSNPAQSLYFFVSVSGPGKPR